MDLGSGVLTDEEMEAIDSIPFFGRLGYDPDHIRFSDNQSNDTLFTAIDKRKEEILE